VEEFAKIVYALYPVCFDMQPSHPDPDYRLSVTAFNDTGMVSMFIFAIAIYGVISHVNILENIRGEVLGFVTSLIDEIRAVHDHHNILTALEHDRW
jgi:hypothetical protein